MTPADRDPYAYIDLARRGRTGLWVGLRGFGRIVLYVLAGMVVGGALVAAIIVWNPDGRAMLDRLSKGEAGPVPEFAAVLLQSVVVFWAVRDATVRTQRRPLMTLIAGTGRFDLRQALVGAVAMLAALLGAGLLASAVAGLLGIGTDAPPVWHWPDANWFVALVLGAVIIPLQAGGEELLFRGWLTQTLGQGIRNRLALTLLVGLLFALAHGVAPGAIAYFTVLSLSLSAVTLKAARLEPAIGAHVAQNLFVLLVVTPLLDGGEPTLLGSRSGELGAMAVVAALLQAGLFYGLATAPAFQRLFGARAARS